MTECEEARCNKEATRTWGGRRICQDHYEQFKEQQEKMIHDMRDAY